METRGTTGEETISYWFDLPIDVAEFEEKLGIGAESGDYRIIEKVLPYADEVHEHTSVYQLNELDFMYRQLSSDMQEEYVSLLTVYENLEALYICRNVITVYPDCKSMIDVARQKLMNDPTFKHLSEEQFIIFQSNLKTMPTLIRCFKGACIMESFKYNYLQSNST